VVMAGLGADQQKRSLAAVTPASGGGADPDNLQAVCESCHVIKTAAEKLTGIRASAACRRARRHLPVKPHPGEMR
jgi:HNH endonuclease